ncbi:MAG: GntR family transcriptional regulator [Pseudomonadota bacterium]|nr:GntR family transcriptional regulator [Pseudomonadota bacterium]
MNARLTSSTDDPLGPFTQPPAAGLAKYAQLRATLASAIRGGHWKPGSQLPAERELARMTNYSLGTVQRALRELADEGIVVRTHGSGTYVAEGRGAIDAPLHLRFLGREGEPAFLPLYPKMLDRQRVNAPGPWSDWLHPADGEVVRISRRISVNGEFDVFNRLYFSARAFPGLASAPLSSLDGANLKQMLGSESSMPVTEVSQRVAFVALSPEAATAVGVPAGSLGMLLESGAMAGREPLYFFESFIPPNARRLDVS